MAGNEGAVLAWITGQPVALGLALFGLVVSGRVIQVLFTRLSAVQDEKLTLVREVMQVTAAVTEAMESNTNATRETGRAVDRLAEQRNRRG